MKKLAFLLLPLIVVQNVTAQSKIKINAGARAEVTRSNGFNPKFFNKTFPQIYKDFQTVVFAEVSKKIGKKSSAKAAIALPINNRNINIKYQKNTGSQTLNRSIIFDANYIGDLNLAYEYDLTNACTNTCSGNYLSVAIGIGLSLVQNVHHVDMYDHNTNKTTKANIKDIHFKGEGIAINQKPTTLNGAAYLNYHIKNKKHHEAIIVTAGVQKYFNNPYSATSLPSIRFNNYPNFEETNKLGIISVGIKVPIKQ